MEKTPFVERDRFFVIKSNDQEDEYITLEKCYEQNDIKFIVHDKFSSMYNWYSHNYRFSEFIFYSKDKRQIKLNANNWTIEKIETAHKREYLITFRVTFSDPLERIRIIVIKIPYKKGTKTHDLLIVFEAIKKLNEISIFQNWKQYDLMTENEKLKEEIESLKTQLAQKNNE